MCYAFAGSTQEGRLGSIAVDELSRKLLPSPYHHFRCPVLTRIQVHLLVSKKGDTTHAHVFDAEFPKSVLDELDEPSHHEKATWPAIYHTRIPYEPYDTFASRITSHLVRDKHSLRIKEAGTGSQCIPKKRKFGQELPI